MRNKSLVLASMAEAMASGMYEPVMPFIETGGPIFHPKKHTVMSYAKQNRLAKQGRRKNGRKK